MKRISILLVVWLCSLPFGLRAQDAATEERLNKLNGYVQDLLEDKANQHRQLESLAREVQSLREQMSKPTGNYASQEDLRRLAEAIKEIDEKREADKKLILKEIENLAKLFRSPPSPPRSGERPSRPSETGNRNERGYEHIVSPGDTLSTISQAFREKGIKVSVDQILKANPGLVPERMQVGQKLWIPEPK